MHKIIKMLSKIPNYIKYLFLNIFSLFSLVLIFRAVFYFFSLDLTEVGHTEIQKAISLGIRFDLKLAVLLNIPIALLLLIVHRSFFKKPVFKKISSYYYTSIYVLITLIYLIDFGYFAYLGTRIDAASLRFLSNFTISFQVLIESYPVFKGVLALIIVGLISFKLVSYFYKIHFNGRIISSKKLKTAYFVGTLLLLSFGIYNSVNYYPLRWSEAFFSKNNNVNQFALNPLLYFFDSFAFRDQHFDKELYKQYYPSIASHLNLQKDTVLFERKVHFETPYPTKPNVVIVMLESVGVASMSHYGNPISTTPHLDSLIHKSVQFPNFYVHKAGTAASVFASITGLPDVEDIKTASRNPMIIDQRILFDQFSGYEKLYFLGGSANWANIRGVFNANIKDLTIYEEGSYQIEDRADVWGIDDYDLFRESNTILKKLHQQDTPFVAYIQTSSNHMPFTVPDKKETFRILEENEVSKDLLAQSGFKSLAQINALRYLDFNVHRFLERAKAAGYYENTIFAFFGDHNTAMNRTNRYTNEHDLNYLPQHVPFVIHAPNFIEPQAIQKNGNLIDLFPTLMSLAKVNHTNYTLGKDLLDASTENASFIYHQLKGEPEIGLLKDSLYYSRTISSNKTHLYDVKSKSLTDIKKDNVLQAQQLDSLLNAYYYSTKFLYFNNKKSAN